MRFAPVLVAGALGVGLLAGPADAATGIVRQDPCTAAQLAAHKAQADYHGAVVDYLAQINAGGHPGIPERENLAQLKARADRLTAQAARACQGR